jgi:hypothetical protein
MVKVCTRKSSGGHQAKKTNNEGKTEARETGSPDNQILTRKSPGTEAMRAYFARAETVLVVQLPSNFAAN